MYSLQCMEEVKRYKVIAKVFSNGKVTIPQEVRQYLEIEDGDFVEMIVSKIDMSVPKDV